MEPGRSQAIPPITIIGNSDNAQNLDINMSLSPNAEAHRIIEKWRSGDLTVTQKEAETIGQVIEMSSKATRMARATIKMIATQPNTGQINSNTPQERSDNNTNS
jgi:hypothetical protein